MPREFQALRLTTGERWNWLPEAHIVETHVREWSQCAQHFCSALDVFEEQQRFADREVEHIADALFHDLDFAHFRTETGAIAIRTTQIHVRQELHFYVLEARARTRRAAAVTCIETKCSRGVAALRCHRRLCEDRADCVESADEARGVRARGLADRRLIDEHDVVNVLMPKQQVVRTGRVRGLALCFV